MMVTQQEQNVNQRLANIDNTLIWIFWAHAAIGSIMLIFMLVFDEKMGKLLEILSQ